MKTCEDWTCSFVYFATQSKFCQIELIRIGEDGARPDLEAPENKFKA